MAYGNSNVESWAPASYKRKRGTEADWPMIFKDMVVVFMWHGRKNEIDTKRLHLFKTKLFEKGGWLQTKVTAQTTHIFANNMTAVLDYHWGCQRCPFRIQSQVHLISYEWFSACLTVGERVFERFFRIDMEGELTNQFENFKLACGVIDSDGNWTFVKGMGVEVKLEVPELKEEAEPGQEKGDLTAAVGEKVKDKEGSLFAIPPWLTDRRAKE